MRIAFFEIKDWEKEELKKALNHHSLEFYEEPLTEKNVSKIKGAEVVSVFIYSVLNEKVISKLPNLKLITTRSTGFDHIDTKFCTKKGIQVRNVPTYGENTVAEHTFALILALSRNIHKAYMRTIKNNFEIEGLKGFDLQGKTLGVIGVGHIGVHVIRIARGFGMNVLALDNHQDRFLAGTLGFEYSNLDNILRNSDIITVHVPLTDKTKHLIDSKALKKVKKGVIIINTSRGEIINTSALLSALKKGIVGGVGLDVIEGEAYIKEERQLLHGHNPKIMKQITQDHELLKNEKVVFTPHIAFYSQEALQRILDTTIENIESFIHKRVQNCVPCMI